MEIINIDINKLKPYKNNPRKNDEAVEYVANSIKEFGFKVPIIVDKDYEIIAGHTRLKAAKQLGLKEVPIIIADDLTEEQVKAFRLADNKVSEIAEWDFNLLDNELSNILDIDMSNFGFDVFEEEEEQEIIEDDFEVIVPEEPKAKLGDIYQLGNHRLMCGDSTKEEDVDKLINGAVIDLVVTDPPYNVDSGSKAEAINKYGYKFSDRHIKNDCMLEYQFVEFLDKAFYNMNKHLKVGGAFYIWHASTTVYEFEKALRLNNLKTRQQLIWVKNSFVLSRQDYHWQHEPCLYGWKEGAAHYFIDDRTQSTVYEDLPDFDKMKKEELKELLKEIYTGKIQTTILREDKPLRSEEHPTMKPVKLIGRLVSNSSRKNENVLDLFGGSGTTLIACEQLNRNCYMMEFDPKYVDVIINRWETFTGQKAVLIERKESE